MLLSRCLTVPILAKTCMLPLPTLTAMQQMIQTGRLLKCLLLIASILLGIASWTQPAKAEPPLLPHRPFTAGFGGLCDGGPLVCPRIDEIAFNARIDAILLTSTSLRGAGLVAPYGFSFGILERVEGGIYTQSAVWRQSEGNETQTRFQQGPMRFAGKGLLWPWRKNPHQHFTVLFDFEYEARLPLFDGQNQLGLFTDLGALRVVGNLPLGGVELGISAGSLFDWHGRYVTPELGVHLGWHLPFLPDVKVIAEGMTRGFLHHLNTDEPIPGALDPASPIAPSGVLGFGIVSRQRRAVDFAMVAHVGFGSTAPFFLTLRFADIAWGKGYPRPQSMVLDTVRELGVWIKEQVASIDPMFNDYCDLIDDPPPHGTGRSMNLIGHRTQDEQHCIWKGIWLKKYENDQKIQYWKNKSGTLLCYDKARKHCFAQRASDKESWEPIPIPSHIAVIRGDCIFEDTDTKQRLTHFGTLTPDGRNCTDGITTFRVGERTAYNPKLRQIDRGTQGTARQHPPLAYQGEPTTMQRLHTALGRGIEMGERGNAQHAADDKAAAALADAKLGAAKQAIEEMTPASLMNGVEVATEEAAESLRHAAADPKGTFHRALDRIKQGLKNTAGAVKEGVADTAQAVHRGVDEGVDWSGKPTIEQAEDILRFGGEKAATAPRDVTMSIAAGTAGSIALGSLRTIGKLEKAEEALSDSKKARKAIARAEEAVAEHPIPAVRPSTLSDAGLPGRHGAFKEAKREAGIPKHQAPDRIYREEMSDRFERKVRDDNGKPIITRNYEYTRPDGTKVVIQDHSAGHQFKDGASGDQGAHLNIRPIYDTRHGQVEGTKPHYPFKRR